MKATIQEYDFHQRILARDDPIAFAALADWLYNPLVQDVRKRAGINADPMLVEEADGLSKAVASLYARYVLHQLGEPNFRDWLFDDF